jgi:hypothetical protein
MRTIPRRFGTCLALLAVTTLAAPLPVDLPPVATWAYNPAPDRFEPQALLDLRHLNETVAGANGFVRTDGRGHFVRGDGQVLRFWAVNSSVGFGFVKAPLGPQTAPDLAVHARFLAKRGVNMVRLHRQISPLPTQPGATLDDINTTERDAIWRAVAAYRREGIYTTLSPYWAASLKLAPPWGLGRADQPSWGRLFFDERLQAAYRSWLKQLLTVKNPYTGLTLAEDPALAILQLQNEDSLLFWTLDSIQGAPREALERRFGTWLAQRHGGTAAADATADGRVALLPQWELTQAPRNAAHGQRLAEQTEFLSRTMQAFNRSTVDYLRHELGVKALINAGNWRTADAARLGDAERWSYLPGEVDASNVYTLGLHQGPNSGWAVMDGDRFTDGSVLHDPRRLPLRLRQTAGRPMLVTEGGWILPGGFAAEGPFLVAAYSSLLNIGGFYWFNTNEEQHEPPRSANGWLPSQAKWTFGMPEVIGSFPAAALMLRRGDLDAAPPAAVERRSAASLWAREPAALPEDAAYDPNRDREAPAARDTKAAGADPFLHGPVLVDFADTPAAPAAAAKPPQVQWDAAAGSCRIDSPRAQGVAAHFIDAPVHELSDVRLRSVNRFGAALVVSLDDRPLRQSQRVLVQFATPSRPTGWQQAPAELVLSGGRHVAGQAVISHGGPPWQVEVPRLQVRLRNPGLTSATALDANGMPIGDVSLQRDAQGVSFDFPPGTQHVVLQAVRTDRSVRNLLQ